MPPERQPTSVNRSTRLNVEALLTRLRRSWPIIASLVGLTLLSMSRFLRYTNADVLVSTLISTERLTFFYWGQDRLASLVPLLAWPVQQVQMNFYLQMLVQGLAFFGLILLFVRFHLSDGRRDECKAASPGATAIALIIAGLAATQFMSGTTTNVFVFEQQYAISLCLFLSGVVVLVRAERRVASAGVVLMGVAVLVIPSTVLFAPAAGLVSTHQNRRARVAAVACVAIGAFFVSSLASRYFGSPVAGGDLYTDFSLERLERNAGLASQSIRDSLRRIPTALIILASVGTMIIERRRISREGWLATLGAPFFAVGWFVVFSANGWVEANFYFSRYFFPVFLALIFSISGAATAFALMLERRLAHSATGRFGRHVAVFVAGGFALLFVIVGMVRLTGDDGVPSVRNATPAADTADRFDVEFVVGPYFDVWPVVFSGRARGDDLLAISFRSEAIIELAIGLIDRKTIDGRLELMCIATDAQGCVNALNNYVGGGWALGVAMNQDPLIIEVVSTHATDP